MVAVWYIKHTEGSLVFASIVVLSNGYVCKFLPWCSVPVLVYLMHLRSIRCTTAGQSLQTAPSACRVDKTEQANPCYDQTGLSRCFSTCYDIGTLSDSRHFSPGMLWLVPASRDLFQICDTHTHTHGLLSPPPFSSRIGFLLCTGGTSPPHCRPRGTGPGGSCFPRPFGQRGLV